MNDNLSPIESINEIKSYMSRSSRFRFLNLRGWSGIWVGLCGIITGFYLISLFNSYSIPILTEHSEKLKYTMLISAFAAVLGSFCISIYIFKKRKLKYANHVVKKVFFNFAIAICAGALFCLFLHINSMHYLIPSVTLIFYGFGLLLISRDTYDELLYLSLIEIILGLLCLFIHDFSLIFWTIGFGFIHIIYSVYLWAKYKNR